MQKHVQSIRCLVLLETQKASPSTRDVQSIEASDKCSTYLADTSLDFRLGQDATIATFKGIDKFDLAKIDTNYMEHELQYQQDRSAGMARFNVPLIGIASDRNWLWLIGIMLGPLFYYLIKDSFANLLYLLDYLYKNNMDQPSKLAILSTSQIISSSTQGLTAQFKVTEGKNYESLCKLTVMAFMFTLPIVLLGLILYDWYFFVSQGGDIPCPTLSSSGAEHPKLIARYLCERHCIQSYSVFFDEPEFLGGILALPIFILETKLFYQICRLLRSLSELHRKIRTS